MQHTHQSINKESSRRAIPSICPTLLFCAPGAEGGGTQPCATEVEDCAIVKQSPKDRQEHVSRASLVFSAPLLSVY